MPLDHRTAPAAPSRKRVPVGDGALAGRLRRALKGDVLFDRFSRGRYSTDASIYQIEPVGVVIPRDAEDVAAAVAIAVEEGVPVLPRGGGTSQCGQTVNEALALDCSRHLNRILAVDAGARTAVVEPGIVLDHLNKALKPLGLWFPVDVSTSAQATIGGMTGNNSCGTRSLRYGNMVHNVRAIEAVLPDGTPVRFDATPPAPGRHRELEDALKALHAREADEIAARFPAVQRKVGGYNIERLGGAHPNLAKLLVGSEGTLAFFQKIELALAPLPRHKVLGVCHFPTFRKAMESARDIVALKPAAVELVDRTMIALGRDIPLFRATMDRFIKGEPDALLLVEFAGEDREEEIANLKRLVELMGDLGLPDAVVEAIDPAFQSAIWEVRKAGLNIMMSMKTEGKPVSFIEDCAVPLERLADYTERLTTVFHKHGTTGTWYAHASEGCLHVRPVLNLKQELDVRKMRAIAEEAFALVREYKGSHSGEHGDGLVRSEFHEAMYGTRLVNAFREVKTLFDPAGLFNPGKIVDPPRMDDRSLFRFKPGYAGVSIDTALDWSEWNGFLGAVEMCNNNGACRKSDPGVMCPSFRATQDEQHVTRGRANTLRLAVTGQLGPDALTSDGVMEALDLCVGCKGCKRECPTGVDMARMKIEVLAQRRKRMPLPLRERLIAWLPRYAPLASRLGPLLNLQSRIPGLPALTERLLGFSRHRPLPLWHARPFRETGRKAAGRVGEVVLFADTFNRWFEADNARAAVRVLEAAGYAVHVAAPADAQAADGGRPLCCGRTFLAAGLVEEARAEQRRLVAALLPHVERGRPIIGLEPSCLLTLRDESTAVLPGPDAARIAGHALLFEEFIDRERAAGRLDLRLKPLPVRRALVHGHCHQKAMGAMPPVERVLKLVPDLDVSVVQSTCCGMAGAFGYQAEHHEVSMRIGELDLLPAVRAADADTILVADGTSCRHQIRDGAGREAVHVAVVLARALVGGAG
ncbi:FAD-binding and (Fe-S)-binding domain-containing protein [Azospirillum canadense]|uniref:FAD-binding and (Fe-S)-binding domain-containing protein n=1 Tax=Azospirillum canadense TaxID=403962 RepID=UPI0022267D87|nr:FAD-binding and (Fe-S)-binding domain-containing protein [Azospirillum canadense]MCW2241335.1 FAD/FMN-containing dehydrogenase/Fe-S oxidoreductase [Azospirillum canadense]